MNQSVWQTGVALPHFPSLEESLSTEVLIIGGGIAGILTAYLLEQQGIPYVLVEKDSICSHTTAHTTAKITVQHGLIYHKLEQSKGLDTAAAYLRANTEAWDIYAKLCKDIDCDYELRDNYIYSRTNPRKIEKELATLERLGASAVFRDHLPLPLDTVGAVCFPKQAQFHPLKFLASIAKGLHIYEHTFVRELRDHIAVTDHGTIRANHIVIATHFPMLNKHGMYFLKLYQHRSYVISLENAQKLPGMYMDESNTGLSFRNYHDLLLLGGGAHRTGKKGGCWDELRHFAALHYPKSTIHHLYATQDCMSLDHMPYIGRYSRGTTDLYTATGFGKWGMTGSMVAAMLLRDLIIGTRNEYAAVFSPSRNMLKPQLAVNAFESLTNLLRISEKRCPHLGCALHWNSAEHSWDCACHGSRFSKNGRLLDNPANGDLPR